MKIDVPVATMGSRVQNNAGQLTQLVPFVPNRQGRPGLGADAADQAGSLAHTGEATPSRVLSSCSQGFSVKALRHAMQAMFS